MVAPSAASARQNTFSLQEGTKTPFRSILLTVLIIAALKNVLQQRGESFFAISNNHDGGGCETQKKTSTQNNIGGVNPTYLQTPEMNRRMWQACPVVLNTTLEQTSPNFIKDLKEKLMQAQVEGRPITHLAEHYDAVWTERGGLLNGFWVEFGVHTGGSMLLASDNLLTGKNKTLFNGTMAGFDSFEGLPVKWRDGYEAHKFGERPDLFQETRAKLPQQVELYKGWFQDTIGVFLKDHPLQPAGFIHHDADLFVSTAITFSLLSDRIFPGTIMCFDEIVEYEGYEQHEILSLFIWMKEHHVSLCPIARTRLTKPYNPLYTNACFQVLSIDKK